MRVEQLLLHLALLRPCPSPRSAGRRASTCRGRCGRRCRSCECGTGTWREDSGAAGRPGSGRSRDAACRAVCYSSACPITRSRRPAAPPPRLRRRPRHAPRRPHLGRQLQRHQGRLRPVSAAGLHRHPLRPREPAAGPAGAPARGAGDRCPAGRSPGWSCSAWWATRSTSSPSSRGWRAPPRPTARSSSPRCPPSWRHGRVLGWSRSGPGCSAACWSRASAWCWWWRRAAPASDRPRWRATC